MWSTFFRGIGHTVLLLSIGHGPVGIALSLAREDCNLGLPDASFVATILWKSHDRGSAHSRGVGENVPNIFTSLVETAIINAKEKNGATFHAALFLTALSTGKV